MNKRLTLKQKKERKAKKSAIMVAKYRNDPLYRDHQKDLKLKRAYGISLEQYKHLSSLNDDNCLICDNKCPPKRRLAVDHDHSNNVIRGLLCINCNKGLGNFKDNVSLLEKAAAYLIDYKTALKEHNAVNPR